MDSTPEQVAAVCAAAVRAADRLADLDAVPLAARAGWLRAIADRLDGHADELIGIAGNETALGPAWLGAELARTTRQLRMFADVAENGAAAGGFLDVVVEAADPQATPPRPDLRRMNQPIGPVAIYAASNFPFAISVAGGDTAAALAAGCPVVVKVHPGHPETSRRTAELVTEALRAAPVPAPQGTFAVVEGFEAGRALVTDPAIRAAAFTGSLRGGRALFDLAVSRPDPIPFFGELGSVNPVFVTPAAVRARGKEIAAGFAASFLTNAGQLCTKPGVLFLPAGHGLDDVLRAEVAAAAVPHRLLTPDIQAGFGIGATAVARRPQVTVLAGEPPAADADPAPVVFTVPAGQAAEWAWEEHFGPAALIVEYGSDEELLAAASAMPGSLSAVVHAEDEDVPLARELVARVRRRAGRIVSNGWPTGVAVTTATHHGGPWPATTSAAHTSMGTAAIRRFVVPVVYQNTPPALLPGPLRGGTERA